MSKRLIVSLIVLLAAGGLMASSRSFSRGPAVMAGHMAAQNGTCTGSGNGNGTRDGYDGNLSAWDLFTNISTNALRLR